MPDVLFFTREGCRLCDEALEVAEREMRALLGAPKQSFAPCSCGPTSVVRRVEWPDRSVLQVIDVDAEPELRRKFGFDLPVVEVVGGPRFSLQLDAAAFAAALRDAALEAAL